jgi:hypothetical protein
MQKTVTSAMTVFSFLWFQTLRDRITDSKWIARHAGCIINLNVLDLRELFEVVGEDISDIV